MNGDVTQIDINNWQNIPFIASAVDPFGKVYLNGTNRSCKLQPNGDCCGAIYTDSFMAVNHAGEVYFIDIDDHALHKVIIP